MWESTSGKRSGSHFKSWPPRGRALVFQALRPLCRLSMGPQLPPDQDWRDGGLYIDGAPAV